MVQLALPKPREFTARRERGGGLSPESLEKAEEQRDPIRCLTKWERTRSPVVVVYGSDLIAR